ncbi:MAG: 4Fe-4S dicluster domain-containing protein [Dehalococcoidales bacterium]|nr:4Fe-4S dicluster domain-containing protein [Dehalococcoidales bacterium]
MRDKKCGLGRRDFIKLSLGTAGALAVMSSSIVVAKKATASSQTDKAHDMAPAAMAPKKPARAWAMIVDLKKCEGCVTLDTPPQCAQACINGHYVPQGEQWIEVFTKKLAGGGTYFMPAPCYQCENAPCVNVCPVAATYHDSNGVVLIDHRRCIGCRMCMAACPYQRRFFNWGTPKLPPEAAMAEYSPIYPVPAVKGTVIKCMFCAHMLENGRLPLCVSGCPMKALYIGDLNEDIASNGAEVVKLTKFLNDNTAFRHKEELGTQPRLWYLPGYGQESGRKPDDPRTLKPPQWPWGGDGFNRRAGIWPWGEDL